MGNRRHSFPIEGLPATSARWPRRHGRLLLLVAVALAVRGAALWLQRDAVSTDIDGYRQIAENLLARRTLAYGDFPTAYRPPLYPLLLAFGMASGAAAEVCVAGLNLLAGVATVLLVVALGRQCGLDRAAYFAALLIAADPILLYWSARTMTETLATLLATLALWTLGWFSRRMSPGRALLAGVALGLAALCRPTFLPWAVLCAVGVAGLAPGSQRRRLATSAALMLGVAVMLAPWIARNALVMGRPIATTSHGGYTLLLGNNPHFYEFLRSGDWGSTWDHAEFIDEYLREVPPARSPAEELRNDRRAYELAQQAIHREPGMFAYACLVRLGRLWSPLAHQVDPAEGRAARLLRYGSGAWYLGVFVLAILGVWQIGAAISRPPWLWGVLLVATVTAVHAFYWSDMRMRAPLMPVVALSAACSAGYLVNRCCQLSGLGAANRP